MFDVRLPFDFDANGLLHHNLPDSDIGARGETIQFRFAADSSSSSRSFGLAAIYRRPEAPNRVHGPAVSGPWPGPADLQHQMLALFVVGHEWT